jgi:transposase
VALEATGHYWRNLFVALLAKGYAVAVLNPLRTRRFAEEELQRTKTTLITRRLRKEGPGTSLSRHSIHAMQKEVEVLRSGRAQYARDPN